MKKLMIAAALAAMTVGVAEAACEKANCTFAYKLVMNGKSTKAVPLTETVGCEKGSACWRQIASIRWVGWVWGQAPSEDDCCECNKFEEFASAVWDAKTGKLLPEDNRLVTIQFINVLRRGGARDKAEVLLTLGETVNLAGFGPVTSASFFKGAHGFFAGSVVPPQCCACVEGGDDEECISAQYFTLCDGEVGEENLTVAYGRWSLKYSALKTAALVNNFGWAALVPGNWEAPEE